MTATRRRRTAPRAHTRTTVSAAPPIPVRKPLNQMMPEEVRAWIQATRRALEQKQARERAYLDRRADRGTHTPTDDAYKQDQWLLTDLLAMLDEMETSLWTNS
jgi:1-acyl-sn-glycerol-3-phosphate acyltransferase